MRISTRTSAWRATALRRRSAGVIVGAFIYARRWPDPRPTVFGYHEVFHLFVIAAGTSHFIAMWRIIVSRIV